MLTCAGIACDCHELHIIRDLQQASHNPHADIFLVRHHYPIKTWWALEHSYHNPLCWHRGPPEELLERTYLMPPEEDGTRVRAKIIEMVKEHRKGLESHPDLVKFKCLVNKDYHEVVAYNDIVDYIKQDQTW